MTKDTTLAGRLGQHLETEYEALIAGDIGEIERLAEVKLTLLEQTSDMSPSELAQFEHLRARLVRNQLLTLSALEGMKAAIQRAKDVEQVAKSLRTYQPNGEPNDLRIAKGKVLSKRS